MVDPLHRAAHLFDGGRYDLAERELRRVIVVHPDEASAYAMLGLCLAERREVETAIREAQTAVGMDPEDPYNCYALGHVLIVGRRFDEARKAIDAALRLDPQNVSVLWLLATVQCESKQWEDAIQTAERGLALDPEDRNCLNVRSLVLLKLGRTSEARDHIDATLSSDPDDVYAYVNSGHLLYVEGDYHGAKRLLREALRLDPNNMQARAYLVLAIRALNPLCRFVRICRKWRRKIGTRGGLILLMAVIASLVAFGWLSDDASRALSLVPWILAAFLAIVCLSALANPTVLLLLRYDRITRHALSGNEVKSADVFGGCFLGAILISCIATIVDSSVLLWLAICLGMLSLPTAGVCLLKGGNARSKLCAGIVVTVLLLATGTVASLVDTNQGQSLFGLGLLGSFFLACCGNWLFVGFDEACEEA